MINMNLLEVVMPPYIYHGCSTRKEFSEGNFAGKEHFILGEFLAVNIKNNCFHNVRKNREIKGSDKYFILDISFNFGSLDKMRITSSDPKDNLGRLGKGSITSLGIKSKARPNKYKKARYDIRIVSMKDLSKIIRKFEKLPYESH